MSRAWWFRAAAITVSEVDGNADELWRIGGKKCRTYGARVAFPVLTQWANLCRASGAGLVAEASWNVAAIPPLRAA